MAGIYIHVPFCRKACTYCDFHFSTKTANVPNFLEALKMELRLRAPEWQYGSLQTLYFGGGTPSVLSPEQLEDIIKTVYDHYPWDVRELTFEINPDDADVPYLKAIRGLGVNRLSIGLQSMRNADLEWMGRTHRVEHIRTMPQRARDGGFDNYTVDFIFGMPDMSMQTWESQLDWAIDQGIPHLSLYALTVEQKTLLSHWIRKGKFKEPDEHQQADEYLLAHNRLRERGYEHYEVSNYALPGKEALHNARYWAGIPYLGFGPSAHSYTGATRRWNVANNAQYIRGVLEGEGKWNDSESLTKADQINEAIMLGLRTAKGIDLHKMERNFGSTVVNQLRDSVSSHPEHNGFAIENTSLRLHDHLWFKADGIAADLFV